MRSLTLLLVAVLCSKNSILFLFVFYAPGTERQNVLDYRMIDDVLSCNPVLFFSNWTKFKGDKARKLKQSHFSFNPQNCPLKFCPEIQVKGAYYAGEEKICGGWPMKKCGEGGG